MNRNAQCSRAITDSANSVAVATLEGVFVEVLR